MLQLVKNKRINRLKWDACIDTAANRFIYAQSWYLDIVSPGWDALVYGDYEAVMPLPRKRKFGIKYLAQPAFAQQLGVFTKNPDASILSDFIARLEQEYSFAELHFNYLNPFPGAKARTNFILDLNRSYEEIAKGYTAENRKNLGKSVTRGAQATDKISVDQVIDFFRKAYGKANPALKDLHYEMFRKLTTEALERKCASLLGVETAEGKLCGGAVFLIWGGRAIYVMGASNEEGRVLQAMHFVLDVFIRRHAGKHLILDFEGSEIPGVAHFYRKFGPENQAFYLYRMNRLPWPIRLLKR